MTASVVVRPSSSIASKTRGRSRLSFGHMGEALASERSRVTAVLSQEEETSSWSVYPSSHLAAIQTTTDFNPNSIVFEPRQSCAPSCALSKFPTCYCPDPTKILAAAS